MSLAEFDDWDELEASVWGEENSFDILLQSYGSVAPAPEYRPNEKKLEEIRKEKAKKRRLQIQQDKAAFREQARAVTKKRARQAVFVSLSILIFSSMFFLVLLRQASINAMNFKNGEMQNKIHSLQQETSQIKEELLNHVDENEMRWMAMEELGMQNPSASQIIDLQIPKGDKLIAGLSISGHVLNKRNIEEAKENLAEYFLEKT